MSPAVLCHPLNQTLHPTLIRCMPVGCTAGGPIRLLPCNHRKEYQSHPATFNRLHIHPPPPPPPCASTALSLCACSKPRAQAAPGPQFTGSLRTSFRKGAHIQQRPGLSYDALHTLSRLRRFVRASCRTSKFPIAVAVPPATGTRHVPIISRHVPPHAPRDAGCVALEWQPRCVVGNAMQS